jgi:hypothetical protein
MVDQQQKMGVSRHPHSSTIMTGSHQPQAKVSTAFAFAPVANFLVIFFFALSFLMLAIFQPSFTRFIDQQPSLLII